jgi:hypothetical protein
MAVFFPRTIKNTFFIFIRFFSVHPWLVGICLFASLVSLAPPLKTFQDADKGSVTFSVRQTGSGQQGASGRADITKIAARALDVESFKERLFSNLAYLEDRAATPFYVSLFVFIILLLGAFNKMSRTFLVLFLMMTILFFIMLGPQTPIYTFLFYHLFYFNLIHAVTWFMPAFLAIFILLVVSQWKAVAQHKFLSSRRVAFASVVFVHLIFLGFFLTQKNIIMSSYITLFLSFLYFVSLFSKNIISKRFTLFLLLACLLVQPVEVLWHYGRNLGVDAKIVRESLQDPLRKLGFSYTRPDFTEPSSPLHARSRSIAMQDSSGFMDDEFPTSWSYYFATHLPEEVIGTYTKYKFYVYDHVVITETQEGSLDAVAKTLKSHLNLAFVSSRSLEAEYSNLLSLRAENNLKSEDQAMIVSAPSDALKVLFFDANSIKLRTHFNKEKFLVYNDSYHPDWQVFINGKKDIVYRANVAFKGVKVPAGESIIYFKFAPLGGERVYIFIFVVFFGIFVWMFLLLYKDRNNRNTL